MAKAFVAKVGNERYQSHTLWDLGNAVACLEGEVEVWVRGVKTRLTRADLELATKSGEPMLPEVVEQVFLLRGNIMPAKKTTACSKFSNEQKLYHAYKNRILKACEAQGFDRESDVFSIECEFHFPLPASAFRKDGSLSPKGIRLIGQPKRSKPDADNCVKPIADALCPGKDEGIWHMSGLKFWGADAIGSTVVRIKSYS